MTMHDEWTDRLSDYLDDELSDQERRAVAAHLAECPDCAHTLDELRAVVIAAQSVTPSVPPIDLWDRVATRIASAEGERPVAPTVGTSVAVSRLRGSSSPRPAFC